MRRFDALRGFRTEDLDATQVERFAMLAARSRKDALRMTTEAGSGHPGGSLSSIDLFLMLWLCADPRAGDHVVVSHGHTVAGVYAVLGNLGFFDVEEAVAGFRKEGSRFEGHPSLEVPGIEWCGGVLGQGLSVGCGFALAERMKGRDGHVFVVMGDGEQQKGQITEAREFAAKFGLSNVTALIDCNGLQASGSVEEIMPMDLARKYEASGWVVLHVDGHDPIGIYKALKTVYRGTGAPTAILARTVMGKGVSGIEGDYRYHGQPLNPKQLVEAVVELDRDAAPSVSLQGRFESGESCSNPAPSMPIPPPVPYPAGTSVANRTAFGESLLAIAHANRENDCFRMAVLNCDLVESLKLQAFNAQYPRHFVQCGIQEHNAATVAGALSRSGILTFFAEFGVFGIDETYGQLRTNDINRTSLKLVCTHCGLDVGEDGKTHQCIDSVGLLGNLPGFRILIPADANQTAHMVRFMADEPGNLCLLAGRSSIPVLADSEGHPFFGDSYRFEYGKADWLKTGEDGTVVTCGSMAHRALRTARRLEAEGIRVGVLNLSCPSSLDEESLRKASETGLIVTYEDHLVRTGIGSLVGTWLAESGLSCRFRRMGIQGYGDSAPPDSLYLAAGLDEESLSNMIRKSIQVAE
jgi:transketolase